MKHLILILVFFITSCSPPEPGTDEWFKDKHRMIDTWKDRDDSPETKERIYDEITEEIKLLNQISHLAHEDTGFQIKVDEIEELSKLLK